MFCIQIFQRFKGLSIFFNYLYLLFLFIKLNSIKFNLIICTVDLVVFAKFRF